MREPSADPRRRCSALRRGRCSLRSRKKVSAGRARKSDHLPSFASPVAHSVELRVFFRRAIAESGRGASEEGSEQCWRCERAGARHCNAVANAAAVAGSASSRATVVSVDGAPRAADWQPAECRRAQHAR